ncbi:HpaII family restriction endonuclease [Arcicella sp. LKC2W]|uniref:HpaII family restriction endonuclease n=1 Tax=Arcicella sp. LKC2W TaxID=2984198 RepID=UPI002B2180EE|nr:HpaII family restriction endonuclease [Arcicella sp. LKC2W]MEA5461263.1 HpaII family restriction endonuclease [Arcicella sp. LKC2W]
MKEESTFKFIDLFAGIGGFHLAMHRLGGECVFASEVDSFARKTYEHNFEKISPNLFSEGFFNDDIRNIMPEEIPDFDVLCAGFPCQPFSQAGQKRGFDDNHKSERGNLFFNIAEIIEAKKPRAFFLENVTGLIQHDNGKTFKTIRQILEGELGYSFYYQVVKASDYGLPQLRPRVFIIGFRDDSFMNGFNFPAKEPLKFTMSDVWEGNCDRKIGFTIRIGGRGSDITDRRNWDAYRVDGIVKKLSYIEARKMQGFPNDYEFPVSPTQAIKQLGNSVAVNAVEAVGKNVIIYMNSLNKNIITMKKTKNKGEWTELLVFIKLLLEQRVFLSDEKLNPTINFFDIKKVTTQNLDLEFFIINQSEIEIRNKKNGETKLINIDQIINRQILGDIVNKIKLGEATFELPDFEVIQNTLGFSVIKGGNSNQKADITLDIDNLLLAKENEGFGIKSYLGSKPTLLNASGNTNFIFEVIGLDKNKVDEINKIDTKTKLKDRIELIEAYGGVFHYQGPEKDTMNYNLKMVDSLMPLIIGKILLAFYKKRIASIAQIIDDIHNEGILMSEIQYEDKQYLEHKIKKFLIDILLGFFAGSKWNGVYDANGTIIVKSTGDFVAFHIVDLESLKNYLFHKIKLDTPSTTRHRFGKLILEKDNRIYFKLNLQLRF